MLRARTLVCGCDSAMRRVASMPLSSGIATSMTTTSGFSCSVMVTASRPLPASPTISMSAWAPRIIRKPWRTTAWSSANKIRVFLLILHNGRGNPGFDGHAFFGGQDFQFPAGTARPGSHAGHADSASRGFFGGINPLSIVADPEANLVAVFVKPHFDTGRLRVAGNIGQSFLGDTEEMGFGFVGETD